MDDLEQRDAPKRVMPWLALVAGAGLVFLEMSKGNLVSFWSAIGLFTAVLAMVELIRR